MSGTATDARRAERLTQLALLAAALAIAAVGARPVVESWNDGSRLATVESLVDRHTLAIDDSVFTRPPETDAQRTAVQVVTQDKVLVGGRFYSDKPPVPALLLAGVYQLWRWTGGASARDEPGRFVYWMTFCSSGLSYAVAVVAVFASGRPLRLSLAERVLLAASFALATVALPYARAVNGHQVLLGVAALLFALLAATDADGAWSRARLLTVGGLGGLGYTLDLAAGPLLLACASAYAVARTRSGRAVLWLAAGAAPWLLLHHAVTYAIGGTVGPVNAVAAHLDWPGSPFAGGEMTGVLPPRSLSASAVYALALLVGRHGFLGHNPTLLVALAGAAAVRPPAAREAGLLACGATWSVATWLTYAALSTNYAGLCASIRWFVPLLVPAYLLLAVLLRERPALRPAVVAVSGVGALLALVMWWRGPWARVPGGLYWPLQAVALAAAWAWWPRAAARGGGPPAAGAPCA